MQIYPWVFLFISEYYSILWIGFLGFHGGSEGKASACDAETRVRSLGREDPLEKKMATPVLLPGESMDGGAWWAAVQGVTKSRTRLSDFTFTFTFCLFTVLLIYICVHFFL